MTTAALTVTRNAPETDSRKTQVTVSRAIHVLSTEDQPRQVVSHRDRTCRNLEVEKLMVFLGSGRTEIFGIAKDRCRRIRERFRKD